MANITPIPSSRVSDQLVRQRLLTQLAGDQVGLVRLQTQLSTGRRIILPSEDAPAAGRATALQQLLERKNQVKVNLTTNQSFLSATDSALSSVSGLLSNARGTALSVVGTTSSDEQRTAASKEIARALQQLVDTGNQQFRGRYLFGGSRTASKPFENVGPHVQYNGNTESLLSFSDIDLMFQTNADGDSVFGAISTPVQGTADLNPICTANTRLADLNGGFGVSDGSISISDGTKTSIVDISNASTLGDVAALLEANPPQGRTVKATVTSTGLTVQIDGGSLSINEVGSGTTVKELGILQENASGTIRIGDDLDPQLTTTTALSDILGVRASAIVRAPGAGNDLVFEAVQRGAPFNGVAVSFVDNPGVTQGNESVLYDSNAQTLVFQIDAGNTTANDIIDALNGDPVASQVFRASLATLDGTASNGAGSGLISTTATAVTGNPPGNVGSGSDLDAAGIVINSGGTSYTITMASITTVEDLINKINGSGAGVLAEVNDSGSGINIRSRLSGADFSIGENGGTTATQLGLRSFNGATELEDLNHGFGVHDTNGIDFQIRRKNGTLIDIDVAGARTIDDIIDRINNSPSNGGMVTARLAASGNGIELVTSEAGTEQLAVIKRSSSQAAEDLGLIPIGADTSAPPTAIAGVETLTGRDVNPTEVSGVFNSLVRLQKALENNDQLGIQRAVELLDRDISRVNLARGEIGARQQGLDTLQTRLDDEIISLGDSLSKEIDVDLPEAISNFTARQASYEASLQTTALVSKLSLLDFL